MVTTTLAPDSLARDDIERQLTEARLNLVAESSIAAASIAAILLFSAAFLYLQQGFGWLPLPCAGLGAVYLAQFLLSRRYLRPDIEGGNLAGWYRVFTATACLGGLFWGLGAVLLTANQDTSANLLTLVFIGALAAAALPPLGILSWAYTAFVAGVLVPVMINLWLDGRDLDRELSLFTAIYIFMLIASAASYRSRFERRFREKLATTDPAVEIREDGLTGLPGRRQFELLASKILAANAKSGIDVSLLYIDLDQFKVINDTCGHRAGDEILRQVARLLWRMIRRGDSLARIGGDEFAILLVDSNEKTAMRTSQLICKSIKHGHFHFRGNQLQLSASIGMATTAGDLDSIEDLMRVAERASYAAKEYGRNRVQVFDRHDDLLHRRNQEMNYAMEIPRALREKRFYLEYQLIVPVPGHPRDKCWYEILLRMQDSEGEVVMPDSFLSAAESYNLASDLDFWVVNEVLATMAANPEALEGLGLCFINLSGQSMGDPNFLKTIHDLLTGSRIPANRICFEITESSAVANLEQALAFMYSMRELGCHFALDDFGSGFSSFRYLRNFPADFIKIDGFFAQNIVNDPFNRAIIASISEIGHATDKMIIAEFVEDRSVLDCLSDIGVDFVQGYGIAIPRIFPPRAEQPVIRISND
ncbi:MAG: EAL domain-containing protein [Gammaproteobacteria bacterium]